MDLQSPPPRQLLPTSAHASDRRNAPRSRNGCWTCRTKKVKCDEARPQCQRCLRLKLLCDYAPRRKERSLRRRLAPDTVQLPLTSDWFQSLLRHDGARSISTFRMPLSGTSRSSVALTATDHEAIRYFRSTFAKQHHTKNPDYSLYSIMFKIAEINPVVMHMVLAVGGQEMEFRKTLCMDHKRGIGSPPWHYSNALKLMAGIIGNESVERLDLDSIYTALYLMLLYEQKYGDEQCTGVKNHLNGAALILDQRYKDKSALLPSASGQRYMSLLPCAQRLGSTDHLSLYSARLIMWMVQFDTAAAFCGVGGHLTANLYKLLSTNTASGNNISYTQPVEKFEQLHHFSYPLYRSVWREEYPQSELLDDVENRNIFSLAGACCQLQFMVAQLSRLQGNDAEAAGRRASNVESSIDEVGDKFSELIEVAASLSPATDNSHRLVANIRSVVPQFYAVVLYFLRLRSSGEQTLTVRQIEALRQIMNLAFQAHKHDSEKAMVRIAWPLFMVALETNDHLHREWVLNRFSAISKFGRNFSRAHRFLVEVVDVQKKLLSGQFEMFVI